MTRRGPPALGRRAIAVALCFAVLLPFAALGLAACSQNEVGKKVITEQCIAEGETVEVCECFAKTSNEKLDKELFDIVVLGAGPEA